MWCKYLYKAAATKANVLADGVALLTGETSLANLSTDCDVSGSELLTTVAAGWTVHDGAAGTNAVCLKAALLDDAATYKYLLLDTNTTGYLFGKVYESWNETTHTGTNLAYNSNVTSYCQRLDLTNGGTLYLASSARFALFFSNMASVLGSSTGNSPDGIFERSREFAWDTPGAGYPPFAHINFHQSNASGYVYPPRVKRRSTTDGTATTAQSILASTGVTHPGAFSETGVITDGVGGEYAPLLPLYMTRRGLSGAFPGSFGEFSSLCDLWMLPTGVFTVFDDFSANGKTYMALSMSVGVKYAIRKG